MSRNQTRRCTWPGSDPLNIDYHDHEWGRPEHDECRLFEMLTLEGAQAGLSWLTILRKRSGYRAAFADFDPCRVADFDQRQVERLLSNPGIVRHRGKIEATIHNARRILALWEKGQRLDSVVWSCVNDQPQINRWKRSEQVPAQTDTSKMLSRQLRILGFRFTGPTTCYAFMQAAGLVNDHLQTCFLHPDYSECAADSTVKARQP